MQNHLKRAKFERRAVVRRILATIGLSLWWMRPQAAAQESSLSTAGAIRFVATGDSNQTPPKSAARRSDGLEALLVRDLELDSADLGSADLANTVFDKAPDRLASRRLERTSTPPQIVAGGESDPALVEAEVDPCAIDVWLVSTRDMPGCESDPSADFAPAVWRHEPSVGWTRAELSDLTDGPSATMPTAILVHGNQFSLDDSIHQGWQIKREIAGSSGARRLVIWTWPSDRIRGSILKDVEVKARAADVEGRRLGRFLLLLKPPAPITLVGFSYGAKVILGGLHAQASGATNVGEASIDSATSSPPLRAVLLAAAVDRTWLEPGGRLERAFDEVEEVVTFVNPHDRVLQWFQRLPGGSGGQALGYAGLCGLRRGEHFDKVVEVNSNPFVGRRHAWDHYIRSRPAMSRLRCAVDAAVASPHEVRESATGR